MPGTVSALAPSGEKAEGDIVFPPGAIDEKQLVSWVTEARKLAEAAGRLGVCDCRLGQVLAHAPSDPGGQWPCEPVRNLIERLASRDVENGLAVGVHDKRGVHFRGKGGAQERALSEKFRRYKDQASSRWPRTAAVLNRIAEDYVGEAARHDENEELEEFE